MASLIIARRIVNEMRADPFLHDDAVICAAFALLNRSMLMEDIIDALDLVEMRSDIIATREVTLH